MPMFPWLFKTVTVILVSSTYTPQALEKAGDIESGSVTKIRKEAKAAKSVSTKSVQLLANAMEPVCKLDMFLPKSAGTVEASSKPDSLERRPVLIICSDEERKQTLIFL